MGTEKKRLSFALTPDVEEAVDRVRKEHYDKNKSEVIRTLILLGLNEAKEKNDLDNFALRFINYLYLHLFVWYTVIVRKAFKA